MPADWPAVEEIYPHGIEDGEATFETQTPTWEAFDAGKAPDTTSGRGRRGGTRVRLGRGIRRLVTRRRTGA